MTRKIKPSQTVCEKGHVYKTVRYPDGCPVCLNEIQQFKNNKIKKKFPFIYRILTNTVASLFTIKNKPRGLFKNPKAN
jgi:hypothetical protein